MADKIISYNGATVALKRATVRSRLHSGIIYRKFDVRDNTSEEEFSMLFNYVKFLTQTTITGDIGFLVPSYADTPEKLREGMDAFLEQPEAFFDTVIIPLTQLGEALTEPALQPDAHEKKA